MSNNTNELLELIEHISWKMDHIMIRLSPPCPDDVQRYAIWKEDGSQLKPEITIFDLDNVLGSLKNHACARPAGQNWFEYIKWVFWG